MTTSATETGTQSLTGHFDLDPTHSRLGFATKHAMVATVRGAFTTFTGEVYLDEENPQNSWAKVEIDASSINTGNGDRDAHLRNADFFDVENHPTITFTSTKVEPADDDVYTLIGDLSIHGETHPVSIDWELTGTSNDPWGKFRAGFEGKATINRRDWGLAWNVGLDKGGVLVGEKVKLEFDIAAVKRT